MPSSFESQLKKEKKPHRCNDRVEDVIEALFEGFGDYRNTLWPAWRIMVKCFRSKEGDEPRDPYVFLTERNPCFVDHQKLKEESEGLKDKWN